MDRSPRPGNISPDSGSSGARTWTRRSPGPRSARRPAAPSRCGPSTTCPRTEQGAGSAEMDLASIYRAEYGRCVATLTRILGDINLAEDAVQDAFTVALQNWESLPPNPGAWIVTTARNRAVDRLRRESTREARHAQALL